MVGAEVSLCNNGGSPTQCSIHKDESLLNQTTTVQKSQSGAESTDVSVSCGFQPHLPGPATIYIYPQRPVSPLCCCECLQFCVSTDLEAGRRGEEGVGGERSLGGAPGGVGGRQIGSLAPRSSGHAIAALPCPALPHARLTSASI